MNKQYVYINDKVLISDDEGNLKETNNYDITNEILTQENVVEAIQNKINAETKEEESIIPSKKDGLKCALAFLIGLGVIYGMDFVMTNIFHYTQPMVTTTIGTFSRTTVFTMYYAFFGVVFTATTTVLDIAENSNRKKRIQALRESIKFLNKRLTNEIEKLKELNDRKNKVVSGNGKSSVIVNLNINSTLSDIDKYALAAYNIGYDPKKYHKSYQEGRLRRLLDQENESENVRNYIDMIEERNTEEKQLVKTR